MAGGKLESKADIQKILEIMPHRYPILLVDRVLDYEPEKKILISGDHILGDITPHIQCWRDEWNPLKDYLESLDRVRGLDVDHVLPGHRGVFHNLSQRITEIETHHQERAEEIIAILGNGPKTAFSIATKMSWDISYASWEDFPTLQKWFALGETIAHLKYLLGLGKISRNRDGEFIFYKNAGP